MNTFQGIALDIWVNIDNDCSIKYEAVKSEAQIELGHQTGSLQLIVDEQGLARLVEVLGQALRETRS